MWNLAFFAILVCTLAVNVKEDVATADVKVNRPKLNETLCMFLIYVSFIMFAGLRTRYNDTANYMSFFRYARANFVWSLDEIIHTPYWGFETLQTAIKKVFGDNAQWLIMISSIITNVSFLRFYRKYSKNMAMTLLCFIIIQPFMLTCAALKQSVAIAISLWGIDGLINGNKPLFFISLAVAYTFHPYIIVLAVSPLILDEEVWSERMGTIVFISFILSLLMSQILGFFINLTEGMSRTYTAKELLDHTMNPLRVIVDGVPVLLSFILKDTINEKKNRVMNFGINLMTIFFMFSFASLFGNPIYIYRMGNYFGFMIAMVIPWMLFECVPNDKWKPLIILVFFVAYIGVFLLDSCGFDLSYDPFRHTSIATLFEGWLK